MAKQREKTSKRDKAPVTHLTGRWFAPPTGGYSGLGPNGAIVERRGAPPSIPATPEGVRRMKAAKETGAS